MLIGINSGKYGYDCLIIWGSEPKNPEKVIEKIRGF